MKRSRGANGVGSASRTSTCSVPSSPRSNTRSRASRSHVPWWNRTGPPRARAFGAWGSSVARAQTRRVSRIAPGRVSVEPRGTSSQSRPCRLTAVRRPAGTWETLCR